MNKTKLKYILFLLSFPVLLLAQYPNSIKPQPKQKVYKFTPPHKTQSRFRKKYIGTLNGRAMQLGFIEKLEKKQLRLTLTLTDLLTQKVFIGKTNIDSKSYLLKNIVLTNPSSEEIQIQALYLHNYNSNFINFITKDRKAGCFAWNSGQRYESSYPAKPFANSEDFIGYYEGRIDGRLAEFRIEKRGDGLLFNLLDKEQKITYWTFLPNFPKEKEPFVLSNIFLKSTTNHKEITIGQMLLDRQTNQIISGHFFFKQKPVGLFFIRKLTPAPSLIPEFPWPPPTPSDLVKLPDDFLEQADSLGGINWLITNSLDQSGYRFRPQKYFYTPNGFALVTELEQVDCEATPLAGDDRWNVNPSEFEKNFTLLDYLRSLVFKEEALFRVFAFVVTDDLNPVKSIEPTIEETEGWFIAGSAMLPNTLAKIPLNEHHYCQVYVYEFSKTAGQIQAEMVRKGRQSCWRSGETHLKNTKILDHLFIKP